MARIRGDARIRAETERERQRLEARSVERELQELAGEVDSLLRVARPDSAIVVIPRADLFAGGTAVLSARGERALQELAALLLRYDWTRLIVEYGVEPGERAQERAEQVRKHLVAEGLAAERVAVVERRRRAPGGTLPGGLRLLVPAPSSRSGSPPSPH